MKCTLRSSFVALALVPFASGFACGSSGSTPAVAAADGGAGGGGGTGAHAGIVPADLRDVERDGEGLVTTTFGAYPERTPDWTRAASVLSLLKQVWGRGKTANPGLPAPQVMAVDAAIAKLDTAIAAKDQKAAVYASNEVGLACPELFDFFHPDAPKGVLRMDAVFRQVGLDAHFGDTEGVKASLASLKSDWAATKDAVATRAPTCHRVGGTAMVASDIEQSFANLDTAIAANDEKTIEIESDNGALEIDTLELLFDCPADGPAPGSGLGSKCSASTTCGEGLECDLGNAGGKCAPAASNKIGTACASTIECGTDPRAACSTASGDAYPGGYCTMEPCNDVEVCPSTATCVAIGGEVPACLRACKADADCRTAEGYVCQLFVTTPPHGFGPTDHACAFACKRDADCQSPLKCNVGSGKCTP